VFQQLLPYIPLAITDLVLEAAGLLAGLAKMQTCCREAGAEVRAELIAADTDADEIVAQAMITKARAHAVTVSKCIDWRCCRKLLSSVQSRLFIPTKRKFETERHQRCAENLPLLRCPCRKNNAC